VNAAEQQITLQLMAEPRIATIPSTMAQTASNELVVIAPAGCKHIAAVLYNQPSDQFYAVTVNHLFVFLVFTHVDAFTIFYCVHFIV